MIRIALSGHKPERNRLPEASLTLAAPRGETLSTVSLEDPARLRQMVDEHSDFIWRSLRRLGVPQGDVDDAAQQVYIVAASKLASIERGRERAFLFAAALRVASHARRGRARRLEVASVAIAEYRDEAPGPDELADQRRGRALLDAVLASMPLDLRAVLVLFEVEEMSMTEIAILLDVPRGTIASRLRRAREELTTRVDEILRRQAPKTEDER